MENDVVFVAFTCADGRLCIMQFITCMRRSKNDPGILREASDANIIEEFRRSNQQPVSWRRVTLEDLPTHRVYRDAWHDIGTRIDHDISKVRNITIERCRRDRNQKLDALDKEWMKATGQGKKSVADAVEAQRQVLRDLPATITAETVAMTTDDIIAHCILKNIPLE